MILANLEDIAEQVPMSPAMERGIEYLRSGGWRDLAEGRVDLDGDAVYVLIQHYETLPVTETPQLEGHRRYIDLQFVAQGEEVIGWAPIDRLKVEVPYDEGKDIWFGSLPRTAMTALTMTAGQLAIFYPSDGHLPKRAAEKPCAVKKVLVKVAVNK